MYQVYIDVGESFVWNWNMRDRGVMVMVDFINFALVAGADPKRHNVTCSATQTGHPASTVWLRCNGVRDHGVSQTPRVGEREEQLAMGHRKRHHTTN